MYQNVHRYSKLTYTPSQEMKMSIFQFLHWLPDDAGARRRPGHHGAVHQDSQDKVLHRGVTH